MIINTRQAGSSSYNVAFLASPLDFVLSFFNLLGKHSVSARLPHPQQDGRNPSRESSQAGTQHLRHRSSQPIQTDHRSRRARVSEAINLADLMIIHLLILTKSIPYNYINLDFAAGEIKSEWYTAINPNGRVPAIVHVKDDGTAVTVFESAACLLYMASEFDKENKLSYPVGTQEYWTQLSWVSSPIRHLGFRMY